VKKFVGFMLTLFLLMAVFSAFAPQLAAAEELKPVVTVSFAGYEEVRANVEAIGKLGGNAQLSQFLEGMLNMMTQGKVLSNIDKNRLGAQSCNLAIKASLASLASCPSPI